jgi:hypothetical protein
VVTTTGVGCSTGWENVIRVMCRVLFSGGGTYCNTVQLPSPNNWLATIDNIVTVKGSNPLV